MLTFGDFGFIKDNFFCLFSIQNQFISIRPSLHIAEFSLHVAVSELWDKKTGIIRKFEQFIDD